MAMLELEEIKKDEFIKKFIISENESVGDHVANLLKSSNLSAQMTQLANSINKLDQQIHLQVTNNHGDLLAQTENVELMEKVVQSCSSRAKNCQIDRLQNNIEIEYNDLNLKITQLSNLYKAKQAIRKIEQVIKIDEKIDDQKNHNLAQVAINILKIEYLCNLEPKLIILKSYLEKVTSLRQNIEKQTENLINQGLNANSGPQVVSSIQIFLNLNVLQPKIDKVFNEFEKTIEKDIKNALQIKQNIHSDRSKSGPGRGISSNQGVTNTQINSQIWSNIEGLSTKNLNCCNKVKLLWSTLLNEKDSLSNINFFKFIDESKLEKFWENYLEILLRNFSSIPTDFIKLTFEKEFPRLLQFINSLGTKIEDVGDYPTLKISIQSGLRVAVSNYEKAFLSRSLAKLFDSVNNIFAKGICPSKKEMDIVIKMISNELSSIDDPTLKKLITRNISKTISLVCHRCEQLIINDGNSSQVIGPPTESQLSNVAVINILDYFKTNCQMTNEILEIENLMKNSISSLIDSISDSIEAIILTMHKENFKRKNRVAEYSLYMGELQSFVLRAAKDYLSLFASAELIQSKGRELSSRAIELFVRNVVILTTINETTTKNQILIDLNQLEVSMTPLCGVLSELGRPFKILKGLKSILGMKIEEIANSNLIGTVPYSTIIHLLFSLSAGEIKPPHTVNNWSITRYSKWLDEHNEDDRLNLIRNTLEIYVQSVRNSSKTEFSGAYPHIYSLLQRGLNAH